MVQDYKAPPRIYEYPFELVMKAYERRFPTCHLIPDVEDTQIISEYKSDDESIHVTERRCTVVPDAPYLLKKISGVERVYFIQKNTLNWANRTLVIEAHNETFSSRITVMEKCTYSVDPNNEKYTVFNQEACLDVKSFFGFESAVEKFAIKAYKKTLSKSKEIILYYINELLSEGIDHVPIFKRQEFVEINEDNCRYRSDSITLIQTIGNQAINDNAILSSSESFSITLYDIQLDENYVKKYIGEISLIESNSILILHQKLLQRHDEITDYDYVRLLQFSRANDLNVEKAYHSLVKSILWRRQNNIGALLSSWSLPPEISPYFYGTWHYTDKDHRPLYLLKLGQMDLKGILKSIGPESFCKQIIYICEQAYNKTKDCSDIYGVPIMSWTCICDLEGLSLRHAWRPIVRTVLRLIEILESNYPETLCRVILVRVPRIFTIIWAFVSTLISDSTRNKFIILTDQCLANGKLLEYVPTEYAPQFLGGNCEIMLPTEKSLVPRELYSFSDNGKSDIFGSFSLDDFYKSLTITKTHFVEVSVNAQDGNCVITWDFDVLEGSIRFGISKTQKPPQCSSHQHNCGNYHPNCDVLLPFVTYEEGNSVQGSYCVGQTGVYNLCFEYVSGGRHHKHKSSIIYNCEVLPSNRLKDSLSDIVSTLSNASLAEKYSLSSYTSSSIVSK